MSGRGCTAGNSLLIQSDRMSTPLKFGAAVLYVDDVPAALDFYRRALGLEPRLYDEAAGFAELGADGAVAIASHAAGEFMMPGAYARRASGRSSGVELAFFTDDVPSAFERAVSAGAAALTAPRVMPWGQTVAYVESMEGTIIGFVTPVETPEPVGPAPPVV